MRQVEEAAQQLLAEGFLLEEDAVRYVDAAKARNPLDESVPLAPLALSNRMPVSAASPPLRSTGFARPDYGGFLRPPRGLTLAKVYLRDEE